MPKSSGHSWRFKARFRRHAFGWKSQPAIARLQEAVAEITLVARIEPILGAEGAVALLERISPALEHVDSSSGAIGTAVNHTIAELVPVIVAAPADEGTRAAWLERLFEAHSADQIPYIERLADYWGELCGSRNVASAWADRLIGITRLAFSPDKNVRAYFHGTSACLSALFAAGRHEELVELGDEGKWFAAAKDNRLFDEAVALVNQTPCDPRTLTRAARDFAEKNPAFAVEAGFAALRWLVQGYGYEITSADVWTAYTLTIKAAANAHQSDEVRNRIRALIDSADARGRFVANILGREVGLS